MRWLFAPLLMLIAKSTESELAAQVEFLRAENAILRRRCPKRFHLTMEERRLIVKLGQAVGRGVKALLTCMSYQTYRRWVNRLSDPPAPASFPNRHPGRPRKDDEIRGLVIRLARENDWGYTRILGEMKKLGISGICRTTVINILKENRFDPKTDAGKGSWAQFLRSHAKTLWQCDFFSKNIVTPEGVRQCFVLAFLHVSTRRVWLSPCTFTTNGKWLAEQAKAFVAYTEREGLEAKLLLRDRDSAYTRAFDGVLEEAGVEVSPLAFRSPNLNAYAERFIQSIQQECLDKFVVFDRGHMTIWSPSTSSTTTTSGRTRARGTGRCWATH